MKKILLVVSAIFLGSSFLAAQSQVDLNQNTYEDYKRVEKHRKQAVSEIRAIYAKNTEFLAAFSAAEERWEAYREAYLEMLFPGKDKQFHYGSVYPMAYNAQKAQLTQQHIKELDVWLNGVEEGDIGWGAVMLKQTIDEQTKK